MHTHSVSCWRVSDKAAVIVAWFGSPVRWSTRHPSCRTMLTLPDRPACLITTLDPGTDFVVEEPGVIVVKWPLPLPLVPAIQYSKGVRTFARRGAHFRTKSIRLVVKIPVHFTLKTGLRPSFIGRKSSHCIGAHLRTKGCALLHEGVRTFGRSESAYLVMYQSVGDPRLFLTSSDLKPYTVWKEPVMSQKKKGAN
jgi:hypothetical protein